MNLPALTEYLASLENQGIPACDCVVYHAHEPVFRHSAGYTDATKKKSLGNDAAFWLYSATKLITCTAVMRLVESEQIGLDAPVAAYLPEYEDLRVKYGSHTETAKTPMTIRHLLSIQSGLNYDIDAPSIRKRREETNGTATTREIIGALAGEPLDF